MTPEQYDAHQKRVKQPALPAKKSKYKNSKVVVDGEKFDSKRECQRWHELRLQEKAGVIRDLRRQVKYELIPKNDTERAVNYIADFEYIRDNKLVVEDAKGIKTPEYIIKRKLMLWIHGIKIVEV